ncbi:MAG TPA: GNAT family N-acetyltransferase [Longimicrobium sp.]|nr:GNAT family N-acetyltransferase [Longimicrobium sp.]
MSAAAGPEALRVEVRPLGAADLARVAEVHRAAFPGSALTALGGDAPRRYYAWLLAGPHDAHPRGAFAEGRLVGFCFGGVYRGALTGYVRGNAPYLALRALLRPRLLLGGAFRKAAALGARLLVRTPRRTPPPGGWLPSFGILSIAVHPEARGTGAARALMDDAEAEARRRGFGVMHLSVRPENARAVRFYEKCGWERRESGGEWNGIMIKWLGGETGVGEATEGR